MSDLLSRRALAVQRACACGGACGTCSDEDVTESRFGKVQRLDGTVSKDGVGADGDDNPVIADPCSRPFLAKDFMEAAATKAKLSTIVPSGAAVATGCGEVKGVWDAYFERTSTAFAFKDSAGSCVATSARDDDDANSLREDRLMAALKTRVPALVAQMTISSEPDGAGSYATKSFKLEETGLPAEELHPDLEYNHAFDGAANVAGGVGRNGEGSDIFGDDDRLYSGTVWIEVVGVHDSTYDVELAWTPQVHVKDTADFCPGNLGNWWQRQWFTSDLARLEATGLVRDVPLTIDYERPMRDRKLTVPKPTPKPEPKPAPANQTVSGTAVVKADFLRKRSDPTTKSSTIGLIPRGETVRVSCFAHGQEIRGDDVWCQLEDGSYVAHSYLTEVGAERVSECDVFVP